MAPDIQAFAVGFPVALAHAGLGLALLVTGGMAYGLMSPHGEVARVREGSVASAVVLGGALVGLAIPLAVAVHASVSWIEAGLWGLASVAVQLLVFRLTDALLRGLPRRALDGEIAAAVLLAAARLATSLIIAAAVAG